MITPTSSCCCILNFEKSHSIWLTMATARSSLIMASGRSDSRALTYSGMSSVSDTPSRDRSIFSVIHSLLLHFRDEPAGVLHIGGIFIPKGFDHHLLLFGHP